MWLASVVITVRYMYTWKECSLNDMVCVGLASIGQEMDNTCLYYLRFNIVWASKKVPGLVKF